MRRQTAPDQPPPARAALLLAPRGMWWAALLALAAALPAAALAASSSTGGAETRYLARLLFAGSLPVLLLHTLAGPLRLAAGLWAALAGVSIVALPEDSSRGLALTVVLAVGAAFSVVVVAPRLAPSSGIALAGLALGVLAHPEQLLMPQPSFAAMARLLAPPLVTGLGAAAIARRFGPAPALLVFAHCLLTAGRFSAPVVLLVLALAGATLPRRLWPLGVVLTLLPLLRPSIEGALLVVAALALLLRRHGGGRFVLPVLLVASGLLALQPPARGWSEVLGAAPLFLVLLAGPACLRPLSTRDVAAAALLGLTSLRLAGGDAGLALLPAGAALATAALGDDDAPPHPRGPRSLVLALLLVLALVPRGYPLLRPSALTALRTFPVGGLVERTLLSWPPRTLSAKAPVVHLELPGDSLRAVTVDSALIYGADLPYGTLVATVALAGGGTTATSLLLRAGIETAEWSAAARPGTAAPAPHLSWVSADGRFFGQRYRARWPLAQPREVGTLTIERTPGLPQNVELVITHIGGAPAR